MALLTPEQNPMFFAQIILIMRIKWVGEEIRTPPKNSTDSCANHYTTPTIIIYILHLFLLFGNIDEGVDTFSRGTIIDYGKKAKMGMQKSDIKKVNKPCLSSKMLYTVTVLAFGKIRVFK